MMEEKALSAEIDKYNKKFENWSNIKTTSTMMTHAVTKKQRGDEKDEKLPKEVILFEVYYKIQ